MKIDQLISFAIPTYNRSEYLDHCLERLISIVSKYNIKIYISDNHSSDCTKDVVERWQELYDHLYYHCNESNLDMDGNFEVALNLPKSEYVWLFGDTYQIESDNIIYLFNLLKNNSVSYDGFVFNLDNIISLPTKDYVDQNELLVDLSGIMSCVSCLVYSQRIIKNALFTRYKNTFFSLEAIIFEYIDCKDFVIHWAHGQSVKGLTISNKLKKNWSNSERMLEIGVEGWLKFIYALPASYSLESKYKVEKLFGKTSRLLSYKGIIMRRIDGALTLPLLMRHYKSFIKTAGFFKLLIAFLLCLTPKIFLKRMFFFLKYTNSAIKKAFGVHV